MATIRFRFDKRIAAEAALLDRLNELPEDRHIEYLRNLAVKGFLEECAGSPQPPPPMMRAVSAPPVDDRAPASSMSEPRPAPPKPVSPREETQAASEITLASLKQLVG